MARTRIALLALTLTLLGACGRDLPLPIWINDPDFDEAEERALLAAMESWERATGLDIFTYRGRVSGGEFSWEDYGDDIHGIYKVRPDAYETGYIEHESGQFAGYGTYGDVILNIDSSCLWRDAAPDELVPCYRFEATREACYLRGLQDLAAHELGHFIGIAHISGRRALMNPDVYGVLFPTEVDVEEFWSVYYFLRPTARR